MAKHNEGNIQFVSDALEDQLESDSPLGERFQNGDRGVSVGQEQGSEFVDFAIQDTDVTYGGGLSRRGGLFLGRSDSEQSMSALVDIEAQRIGMTFEGDHLFTSYQKEGERRLAGVGLEREGLSGSVLLEHDSLIDQLHVPAASLRFGENHFSYGHEGISYDIRLDEYAHVRSDADGQVDLSLDQEQLWGLIEHEFRDDVDFALSGMFDRITSPVHRISERGVAYFERRLGDMTIRQLFDLRDKVQAVSYLREHEQGVGMLYTDPARDITLGYDLYRSREGADYMVFHGNTSKGGLRAEVPFSGEGYSIDIESQHIGLNAEKTLTGQAYGNYNDEQQLTVGARLYHVGKPIVDVSVEDGRRLQIGVDFEKRF